MGFWLSRYVLRHVTTIEPAARCAPSTQKAVLLAIADRADGAGLAYCSVDELAESTLYSKRAVQGAIKALVSGGWIETQSPGGGRARVTRWQTWISESDAQSKCQLGEED
jgi:DNA-binding MarR family transcriptional regulator